MTETLFQVMPYRTPPSFSHINKPLRALCQAIKSIVGCVFSTHFHMYRVVETHYFSLLIEGDKGVFDLTLMIDGYMQWPKPNTLVGQHRIFMPVTDMVDAFWLLHFVEEIVCQKGELNE